MEINTPENMSEQQRYCEKIKEKCQQKGRGYFEENKGTLQKIAHDTYQRQSEKEKIRKKNMLEIDIVICMKKTNIY